MSDTNIPAANPNAPVAVLEAKVDAQGVELATLKAELQEARQALKDLAASSKSAPSSVSIATADSKPAKIPTCPEFTVKSKRYKFVVPSFIIDGERHVAEDIVSNKQLLESIVANYPGLYEEQ
jgi:hypothetical protein